MVICPPLFDEYRRCYRAIADLANAVAAQGLHVIRFDYSGTGESQGGLASIRVEHWIEDVTLAINEGIALTGAQSVVLAGVRFGATLAMQCSHPCISQYLLWDPFIEGSEYQSLLSQKNEALARKHRWLAKYVNKRAEDICYDNFALSEALSQGIAKLTIKNIDAGRKTPVSALTTDQALCARLEKIPGIAQCRYSGFDYDWPDFHEGNFHPKPVLEQMARMALRQ
jgi:pimeloyl-ACP methyl ester carboxylesterase